MARSSGGEKAPVKLPASSADWPRTMPTSAINTPARAYGARRRKRLPAADAAAATAGSDPAALGGRIHASQIRPPTQKVMKSSASQVEMVWRMPGPSSAAPLETAEPPAPGKLPVGSTLGGGGTVPSGRAIWKRNEPPATCPSTADCVRQTTT